MEINIKTIPHKKQRYPTPGDYWIDKHGVWQFRVSKMKDWRYEMLVIIHELTEWFLSGSKGVKVSDIDKFDINFEWERSKGLHTKDEEPGFDPDCPIFREHAIATKYERQLARESGVDWEKYDNTVNEL